MIIGFADKGWEDYQHWVNNNSNGLGKPERLKENFHGYFSRRITAEHRLVYKKIEDLIVVAQCIYHY